MPRYFFNTADGESVRDADGDELPDLGSAKGMAVDVMAELLPTRRDGILRGQAFSVTVLDENREPVFALTAKPEVL